MQRGFTLIELVVVIAILGVLAAVAAPKFFALQTEARKAALSGLRAAVGSAALMSFALQSAQSLSPNATITVEGASVTMLNGWPDAVGATGLAAVIRFDPSVFETVGAASPMTFQVRSAATAAACSFTYTNATATVPAIVGAPVTSGC